MAGANHLRQSLLGDMGVDLSGGDVGMAEQGLNHAQIGAAIQKVRGEGVAKDMRTDSARIDAGRPRGFLKELGEAPWRQSATPTA
jgi:hypothetical protein